MLMVFLVTGGSACDQRPPNSWILYSLFLCAIFAPLLLAAFLVNQRLQEHLYNDFIYKTPTEIYQAFLLENLIFLLGAFLVITLLIYFAVRRITRPIIHLSTLLDRLGDQDFHFAHDPLLMRYRSRRDEIGVIARALVRVRIHIANTIQDLLRQQSHYQALYTNTNDAIAFFDTQSRVIRANGPFMRLFGYTRAEVEGRELNALVNPYAGDDERMTLKVFAGELADIETIRYDKAKNPIHVHVKTSPIYQNGQIAGGYAIYHDISLRKKYEEELTYLSLHDALTGLYNRAFFEAELGRLEKSRQYPITLLVADIDGLKMINDSFGHTVGDTLLKNFAQTLRNTLRTEDIVCRIGGDEFVALLTYTDETAAERVMVRIQEAIESFNLTEDTLPMSVSFGMVTAEKPEGSLEKIFRSADELMYTAKLRKGSSAKSELLSTLMAAMEERDYITEGHTLRLGDLCQKLAQTLGVSARQQENLLLLAQIHDLGKLGIPDRILMKKGPLNDEEWAIMHLHPEKGYRIASASPNFAGVADLVLKHHECWDGSGYPAGLKGEEIPLECRILAVVDAYDAMVNNRPYRKALTKEQALKEIERSASSQFDPVVAKAFVRVMA